MCASTLRRFFKVISDNFPLWCNNHFIHTPCKHWGYKGIEIALIILAGLQNIVSTLHSTSIIFLNFFTAK